MSNAGAEPLVTRRRFINGAHGTGWPGQGFLGCLRNQFGAFSGQKAAPALAGMESVSRSPPSHSLRALRAARAPCRVSVFVDDKDVCEPVLRSSWGLRTGTRFHSPSVPLFSFPSTTVSRFRGTRDFHVQGSFIAHCFLPNRVYFQIKTL